MENPHSGDESLESLCCIKQAKQMAINHFKLFMLASYASLPPFERFCWFFRGISCQPWVCKKGSALSSLVFVDNPSLEDKLRTCYSRQQTTIFGGEITDPTSPPTADFEFGHQRQKVQHVTIPLTNINFHRVFYIVSFEV